MRLLTPHGRLAALALASALLLFPCATGAGGQPADADAFAQLEALVELAPARQVGQPGNAAIDAWVTERFQAAVERQTSASRRRASEQRIAEADAAQETLAEALVAAQGGSSETRQLRSPLLVRYTLETPAPLALIFVLIALLLVMGWYVQRRKALLVAAMAMGLAAAILPIVAGAVQTAVERAPESGETMTVAQMERRVRAAAEAAYDAEWRAAEALRGMWQTGQIRFPAPAYLPGEATIATASGSARLYQMAPNFVTPGNLPGGELSAPLVYAGHGRLKDFSGIQLEGAVALMEFDSGRRWLEAVQLGARAVVFLEPADGLPMLHHEAAQKTSVSPISVPRFYLPRRDARALLGGAPEAAGQGEPVEVTLRQSPGRWERRELTSDWLFIPGQAQAQPGRLSLGADDGQQVVHIQAFKDAGSIVPELSPAASSAANLVLLMRLLEHFENSPPQRPVMLSVVNDHVNALHGERVFGHMAFANPASIIDEFKYLDAELARQRFVAGTYGRSPDSAMIESLRTRTEAISGEMFEVKKPAVALLRSLRNAARDEERQFTLRLDRLGSGDSAQTQRLEAVIAERLEQGTRYVNLMQLFNKLGPRRSYDALSDEERQLLHTLFAQISSEARTAAAQLAHQREALLSGLSMRRRLLALSAPAPASSAANRSYDELGRLMHPPVPCVAAVTLDLSFGSGRVGLFAEGLLLSDPQASAATHKRVARLANHTVALAGAIEPQGDPFDSVFVDTLRNTGGIQWHGHLGGTPAIAARAIHQFGLPGLTLTGVRDVRAYAFTPHDTTDRLARRYFDRIMRFSERFLPALVDSADLGVTFLPEIKPYGSLSVEWQVHKASKFALNIEDTPPLPDGLVVLAPRKVDRSENVTVLGQVRPWPVYLTGPRGSAAMRGWTWREASALVFAFDDDYQRLHAALDFAEGEKQFASTLKLGVGELYAQRKLVTFDAAKVDLIGLSEPLTLQPAFEIEVLDAVQNSRPQHFGVAGVNALTVGKILPLALDGTGCVFVEPESAFKLRIGAGLAINTDPDDPQSEGEGFNASHDLLRNLVLTGAVDLYRLSRLRLSGLSDKGVEDSTAQAFQQAAAEQLEALEAAQQSARSERVLTEAEAARGFSQRAYTRTRDTINDLIKAVVIFLALVIPFCFFTMKLITPFTDVNRQLALFAGIFVVMALLLRFVHPAFEVAQTPQVVILAFVILGMAVFVSSVVMGRFNSSMNEAVEEALQSESADAPQGRLAGVAFSVGVNNMKRRRIRTTLTTATIVLVTFTMLSVISVGQDVEPVRLRVANRAAYDGFIFAMPGLGPINVTRLHRLRAHFEDVSGADGSGAVTSQTVARVWAQRQDQYGLYLPFELKLVDPVEAAAAPVLLSKVLLGLEKGEDGFIAPMPLVAGRWFSSNAADEVVLSVEGAALLGVRPASFQPVPVWLNGRKLTLVGLLDDAKLEAMRDLSDVPLLPLLMPASQAQALETEAAADLGSVESNVTEVPGSYVARAQDVALLPIDLAESMGFASARSLSVKYVSDDALAAARQAWTEANHLVRFQHVRITAGTTQPVVREEGERPIEPGQYAMVSSESAEVGNILKVAIPTILAGTIIFNTMLGSVMERRKEIDIYNAIGLNPNHVMVFFFAESLVFGIVGAVAGYLIGQIMSIVIIKLDIIELNLNYSSLSVMVVIFLAIAIVLLSTIYPAMMAARAAVPSGQRRWSAPQPEGDEMHVNFPFSYDATRVVGVCAYLREFMRQNSEASTGKFLATLGPVGRVPGRSPLERAAAAPPEDAAPPEASGPPGPRPSALGPNENARAFAMLFHVAPAPYDLGVNQSMEVYAYYDAHVRAHMLSVHLRRLSGETGNWVAVNQPFLETMRQRLLAWRSQRPQTQQVYYELGRSLFDDAPDLPTRGA